MYFKVYWNKRTIGTIRKWIQFEYLNRHKLGSIAIGFNTAAINTGSMCHPKRLQTVTNNKVSLYVFVFRHSSSRPHDLRYTEVFIQQTNITTKPIFHDYIHVSHCSAAFCNQSGWRTNCVRQWVRYLNGTSTNWTREHKRGALCWLFVPVHSFLYLSKLCLKFQSKPISTCVHTETMHTCKIIPLNRFSCRRDLHIFRKNQQCNNIVHLWSKNCWLHFRIFRRSGVRLYVCVLAYGKTVHRHTHTHT